MTTYALNISFTSQQLQDIYTTNTRVIIGKQVEGEEPNVAWQSFKPLQSNTVSWQEEYGIYTSDSEVQHGATIVQLSSVPIGAVMDKLYTIESSGVITGPATGGVSNAFALLNKYSTKDYITVGLYQDAQVNGTSVTGNAVSAAPVLLESTAIMTPSTVVYIWLQSDVKEGSVVTKVISPMTELKFGGGVTNISVFYNTKTGMFTPS